jgi:hypothetical protein
MGLFDKIFGKKEIQKPTEQTFDNNKLVRLLDKSCEDLGNYENYSKVMEELLHGSSILLLSSQNDNNDKEWKLLEQGSTLKLTCVFDLDGLKVLGAFTDEKSLLNYTQRETSFTAMKSQDVLNFCETNGIDRIVINGGQKNAWFTEKSKENVQTHTFQEETTVQIGTPNIPIDNTTITKLSEMFSKVDSILEVYQYGQTEGNEFNIVLGFKMNTYSDNSKSAAINAVQRGLENTTFNQPLNVFFIETQSWYDSITNIDKSLIYKK